MDPQKSFYRPQTFFSLPNTNFIVVFNIFNHFICDKKCIARLRQLFKTTVLRRDIILQKTKTTNPSSKITSNRKIMLHTIKPQKPVTATEAI